LHARRVRVRGQEQANELFEQLDAGEHQPRTTAGQGTLHRVGEATVGQLAQA
jgi:hypothetical protein